MHKMKSEFDALFYSMLENIIKEKCFNKLFHFNNKCNKVFMNA